MAWPCTSMQAHSLTAANCVAHGTMRSQHHRPSPRAHGFPPLLREEGTTHDSFTPTRAGKQGASALDQVHTPALLRLLPAAALCRSCIVTVCDCQPGWLRHEQRVLLWARRPHPTHALGQRQVQVVAHLMRRLRLRLLRPCARLWALPRP